MVLNGFLISVRILMNVRYFIQCLSKYFSEIIKLMIPYCR